MPIEPMISQSILPAVFGIGVGILASILGLGGGVFLVPLLLLGEFAATAQNASGTSIVAVLATSISAAYAYIRMGMANKRIGLLLMPAAIGFAWLGARTTRVFSSEYLTLAFGLFLLYPALVMLLSKGRRDNARPRQGQHPSKGRLILGIIGACAAGFLSGLLGIGGGALLVPLLTFLFGFPMIESVATSLLIMIPSAAIATAQHALMSNTIWHTAIPLAIGTIIGSQIGARIANRIPNHLLRKVFAVSLLFVAGQMIIRAL